MQRLHKLSKVLQFSVAENQEMKSRVPFLRSVPNACSDVVVRCQVEPCALSSCHAYSKPSDDSLKLHR